MLKNSIKLVTRTNYCVSYVVITLHQLNSIEILQFFKLALNILKKHTPQVFRLEDKCGSLATHRHMAITYNTWWKTGLIWCFTEYTQPCYFVAESHIEYWLWNYHLNRKLRLILDHVSTYSLMDHHKMELGPWSGFNGIYCNVMEIAFKVSP